MKKVAVELRVGCSLSLPQYLLMIATKGKGSSLEGPPSY